jgi:hypothetical protein
MWPASAITLMPTAADSAPSWALDSLHKNFDLRRQEKL